jgi:hypothetical protein
VQQLTPVPLQVIISIYILHFGRKVFGQFFHIRTMDK